MPDCAAPRALPGKADTPRKADTPTQPAYLIVLPWEISYPGGVNEVVRNLIRCLTADRTWCPRLLVTSWDHREPTVATDDGIVTIRARLHNLFWHLDSVAKLAKALIGLPRSLHHLTRVFARERVAIVNVHYVNPNVWSFILLRRLARQRFKLILSFHGMDIQAIRRSSALGRWLWRRALSEGDELVCCSRALARELEEVEPAVRGRVSVIHNGIDPQALAADMAQGRLPETLVGRRYIACIATFEQKKGLDVLVRAFTRVAAAVPDLDLVLAGRSQGEESAIRTLISQTSLGERVHVLTDLPHAVTLRIIESARLFALPSRREPFGIVLLEAALLSVPIVATTVGGIPEIVASGETGRLVPADDAEALAGAIDEALHDEIGSRRMAEAMRSRALAEFSWNASFAKYRMLGFNPPA